MKNATVSDKLLKMNKRQIIDVMLDALDYMQQYNGRTKHYCVCKALGLKQIGKTDTGQILFSNEKEATK